MLTSISTACCLTSPRLLHMPCLSCHGHSVSYIHIAMLLQGSVTLAVGPSNQRCYTLLSLLFSRCKITPHSGISCWPHMRTAEGYQNLLASLQDIATCCMQHGPGGRLSSSMLHPQKRTDHSIHCFAAQDIMTPACTCRPPFKTAVGC